MTNPTLTSNAASQPTARKPLSLIGMEPVADIPSYDAVPWFRRQWVALFPPLFPALIVIALTGTVYAKANKKMRDYADAEVWRYGLGSRIFFVTVATVLAVMVAVRLTTG